MSSVAKWILVSILSTCFCMWFFVFRSPSNSQMVGQYHAEFPWGEAQLTLNENHSFKELVRAKTGEAQQVTGNWTLDSGFPPYVSLMPYVELSQDAPGGQSSSSYLPVESQWFWGVHIDLTSYGTGGFRKE